MFAPCIHNTQKPKIWILYIPTWLVCFVILPKATVCSTRNSFETFRQRNNLDVIKRRLLLLLLLPPSWIPIETAAYTVRSKRCRPGDIPNIAHLDTAYHAYIYIHYTTTWSKVNTNWIILNHFESPPCMPMTLIYPAPVKRTVVSQAWTVTQRLARCETVLVRV